MAWTVERLTESLQITPETAERIIGLARGRIAPETEPSTAAMVARCYHPPSVIEQRMHAIDAVLGTCGTEAIWGASPTEPVAEYCNAGESYACTILYDYQAGKFRLTSYGDWIEKYGERYGVV